MKKILLLMCLLPWVSIASAQGFGDNCEPSPFQPTADCAPGDEPDSPPFPFDPPSDPPIVIDTPEDALDQLILSLDVYLDQVFQTYGVGQLSVAQRDAELMIAVNSERAADPGNYADTPVAYHLLNLKLRILAANHAAFSNPASYPVEIRNLIATAFQLEQEERAAAGEW